MATPGEAVRYRAIAGDVYDAVIVMLRPDGSADIDVIVPGTEVRVCLRARQDGLVWAMEKPKSWTP